MSSAGSSAAGSSAAGSSRRRGAGEGPGPSDPGQPGQPAEPRDEDGPTASGRLRRAGRTGWALLGIVGVLVVLGYLASLLSLLVVPAVLAFFPATLLAPVTRWLKDHGVPAALAALASILLAIMLIAGVLGAMVPIVAGELPDLAESAGEGIGEIRELLEGFGVEIGGTEEMLQVASEEFGEAGEAARQALSAAVVAGETVAGILLLLVVLFFYLKDAERLSSGVVSTLPAHVRQRASEIMQRSWDTLGSYFRGQLLVALFDAVLIGAGLLILGIPLAVPLAVLIFFGGLFPVVGAVVTGALAVLVALADQGLATSLIVLALVLVVQQLESNVLEPIILGHAIELHPLVVLLSISAGAITLGVLGAFLAVPTAAIIARAIAFLREDAGQPAGAES